MYAFATATITESNGQLFFTKYGVLPYEPDGQMLPFMINDSPARRIGTPKLRPARLPKPAFWRRNAPAAAAGLYESRCRFISHLKRRSMPRDMFAVLFSTIEATKLATPPRSRVAFPSPPASAFFGGTLLAGPADELLAASDITAAVERLGGGTTAVKKYIYIYTRNEKYDRAGRAALSITSKRYI